MATRKLKGFPRGWFVIAFSEELKPGDVQPLRYFAQDMVAFRTETGKAAVLDAHCPHLGAHLGVGGKVVGELVQCPFHAWRFGADGQCKEIPYAAKIPPRACVRTWPVDERNGMVFLWHDPAGGAPTYEIPLIPEVGSAEWTPWTHNLRTIKTQPREIVENVADKAHFPEVHGTHVEQFENEFVDHMAIQRTLGIAYPRGGGVDKFKLTATYYGPAYQVTEMDSQLPNRLINAHTPIDEHTLHLRFAVMLEKIAGEEKTAGYAAKYIENLATGFAEDVQIWEHKQWRDQPMLCDGDGPIGKLRKWYAQFYS